MALALAALLPDGRRRCWGSWRSAWPASGCSALLPLTISFGQRELAVVGAALSGLLIASYQVGYGIAAFGVGPLQDLAGVGLSSIFALRGGGRRGMGSLSFAIVRRRAPAA